MSEKLCHCRLAVVSSQTALLLVISLVVAQKYDPGVSHNDTSRSGSDLLHLHAVADVDQNEERGKRTEVTYVCEAKHVTISYI